MRPLRLTVLFPLIFILNVVTLNLGAQTTLNPAPTRALGKTSTTLTSVSPNLVEGREFQSPQGVAVDASTSPAPVYVTDTSNSRILGFRTAASFTNGQFADIVLGQPDFVTTVPQGPGFTTRTTGLAFPEGLAVDASGNLYVIDAGNNRILRFPKPFTKTGDQLPDMVIGQPTFATAGSNQGGLSASTLSFAPGTLLQASLTFDSSGNLWVTDPGNNRILRFNASALGATATSGPVADLVLGQANFTANGGGATAAPPPVTSFTAIHAPAGIAFDSSGRLFVSESVSAQRGRVLVWFPPFSNGRTASRMLGVDLNTPQPAPVSEYQFGQQPSALFAVGNQIGVSDTFNSRLLLFPPVEQWNLSTFFQAATTVIGQPSPSIGTPNSGAASPSASSLALPVGAVFFNSELYIADAGNNRMIVMPQVASGFGPATRVLGQLQFDVNSPNLIEGREFDFSSSNSSSDAGVAVDFTTPTPHLYVADPYNNRILGFNDLRTLQTGAKADLVIGQPDFLHAVQNYPGGGQLSASSLSHPVGITVDSQGNLYVADAGNGRVLRFPTPFAHYQPGVMESADLVLGQLDFTSRITDATPRTMGLPYGLAFAGDNGLLVCDLFNNRVMFFTGPSAQFMNGQAAATVFGQPDMNTSTSGSGLNKLNNPHHIAVDSDNRLYVADTGNKRVLIFNRVTSSGNGAFASLSLTTGLNTPLGIDVNQTNGDIWVADAGNNSLIRFPQFNTLITTGKLASDFGLTDYIPLAVTEDPYGDLFVADNANRVLTYYPSLSALNAANFLGTPNNFPLAPGVIATVFSGGVIGQFGSGSESATTIPLPKQLAGVEVLFNNTPAPLFYVGPDQINFQVPSNAPQSGTADIQVVQLSTGRILGDINALMFTVSPGVFSKTGNGVGDAIIVNQDGTLNGEKNQATQGSIVTIYMTGQGFITGMPADGDISNAQLATPYTPTVYVGGANPVPPENITYSGLAPTLVGVWQINVKIPADAITLANSPTQVVVEANSIPSGGGGLGRSVQIYVKRQ